MKALRLNRETARRLVTVLLVLVVLAAAVPAVSAYESHLINVKVRVEQRFNVFKTMRLASQAEINEAIRQGVVFPHPPNPPEVTEPDMVPVFTCVAWIVSIMVSNPHDYPITEVTVKDNFSAELGAEPLDSLPVDLTVIWHSRGKSKKAAFPTQYRILWYVTYVSGDPEIPETVDNSDWMMPGESETLTMMVWTKLNPSGRQEYTSPGTYTLNSGPTAKWFDPDGHQFSSEGDPLYIYAYE